MQCGSDSKVQPGSAWLTRGTIPERVEVVEVDHAAGWATVLGADGALRQERIATVDSWTRRSKSLDRILRAA